MALHDQTHNAIFEAASTGTTDEARDDDPRALLEELRGDALRFAHRAATMVRDFRETYGLKVTLPFIFQLSGVATFILLRDMQANTSPENSPNEIRSNIPNSQIQTSFEECFRCLIGAGMQYMLPRAIARLLYHSATQLRVKLPDAVEQMLGMVAETAWRPSDLHQLNSCWPNWAASGTWKRNDKNVQMEDMLRKWEELGVQDEVLVKEGESEADVA